MMRLSPRKKFLYASTCVAILAVISLLLCIFISSKHKHVKPVVEKEDVILNETLRINNLNVKVFHGTSPEKGLVIFIADKAKPELVNNYAKQFADLSYYVATLNNDELIASLHTNADGCINLADDFIDLAAELQKHYDLDTDNLPILVGNEQGSPFVYAALAQAEKNQFHAGISINFLKPKQMTPPLCAVNNFIPTLKGTENTISPAKHLSSSWYIFQNTITQNDEPTNKFITRVRNARLTTADGKTTNELAEAIQILQWLDPRLTDQISSDTGDGNLPLIEVPTELNTTNSLAIILTGDGGWAEIDKNIAQLLSEKGVPTVALDSLNYFWRAHTPAETAKDIDDVIAEYRDKWHKDYVILIGYSFGADVMPFIANNLSDKSKPSIDLVAMLGMGKTAAFEFHLSSWMDADKDPNRLPLLPEVKKLTWTNSLCIYGRDDSETICGSTPDLGINTIGMKGDHHFDKDYEQLVKNILENAKHPITPSSHPHNGQ